VDNKDRHRGGLELAWSEAGRWGLHIFDWDQPWLERERERDDRDEVMTE